MEGCGKLFRLVAPYDEKLKLRWKDKYKILDKIASKTSKPLLATFGTALSGSIVLDFTPNIDTELFYSPLVKIGNYALLSWIILNSINEFIKGYTTDFRKGKFIYEIYKEIDAYKKTLRNFDAYKKLLEEYKNLLNKEVNLNEKY